MLLSFNAASDPIRSNRARINVAHCDKVGIFSRQGSGFVRSVEFVLERLLDAVQMHLVVMFKLVD